MLIFSIAPLVEKHYESFFDRILAQSVMDLSLTCKNKDSNVFIQKRARNICLIQNENPSFQKTNICWLIKNLIDGLDWTAVFPFSCLHHAIQENFQAKVQSSPETSQGGEGVQSGLGRMETMSHREILDEMLAHIHPLATSYFLIGSFHFTIFLSCYSNTKHCLHITRQNNPQTGLK